MEKLINYTIEEIAAPVKNALVGGPFGSNLVSSDYVNDGVPVIRGQNMGFGRWVTGNFAFVTREKSESLSANIAKPSDIVFTQRGTLGQVAIVPEKPFKRYVISQSQMKLTVDENKADAMFIYYVFRTEEQLRHIFHSSIQTGVPHTNLGILRKTPVSLPSLNKQKAIAKILSSLDDKIELNRRMNATLEAMAKALFKAWFVDFEPVRANLENRPSESASPEIAKLFPNEFDGDLPKDWRIGTLAEISFNHRQNINPNEIKTETAYVGLEHIPRKSIALTDWGKSDKAESTKSYFKTNDILFGKLRPYFHKVVIAPIDGICSTDIVVIRPKESHHFGQILVEFSSDEIIQYANQLSNGAKMPRTSWSDLAKFEIVIPTKQISEEFSKFTISMAEKIKLNIKENQQLAQIRDSLLPRLISGKIKCLELRLQA